MTEPVCPRRDLKKTLSVLWWIFVILLAVLLARIIGAKSRGEVPKVFGYAVLHIVSGSMEPTISTGSYILVKECAPGDVLPGNIISFYSDDPTISGLPNTHRVQETVAVDGALQFVTRGDANTIDDICNARAERLIGVYVRELTLLTRFSAFLDGSGMFIFLIGLQVGTFGVIALSVLRKKPGEKQDGEGSPSDPTP